MTTNVSQLPPKGPILERGEQRVELGERGAVGASEIVDGGNAAGKIALKIEGWGNKSDPFQHRLVNLERAISGSGQRLNLPSQRVRVPHMLQEIPVNPLR